MSCFPVLFVMMLLVSQSVWAFPGPETRDGSVQDAESRRVRSAEEDCCENPVCKHTPGCPKGS
uniref:Teretoxin Tan1.1 n=1 Tax=Terebra anilis TaxID=553697 RepID=T11_TERAN|nr:RecName: Full=Teretoxin Tan1.1; Flags: Precursor [Terebra anilis]